MILQEGVIWEDSLVQALLILNNDSHIQVLLPWRMTVIYKCYYLGQCRSWGMLQRWPRRSIFEKGRGNNRTALSTGRTVLANQGATVATCNTFHNITCRGKWIEDSEYNTQLVTWLHRWFIGYCSARNFAVINCLITLKPGLVHMHTVTRTDTNKTILTTFHQLWKHFK